MPSSANVKIALAEVMERWLNNKPTVLQDDKNISDHPDQLRIDRNWGEPKYKKARKGVVSATDEPALVEGPTSSTTAPGMSSPSKLGSAVASVLETVVEQATVTGSEMIELFADCMELERSTTWVPMHANCKMCGGFCFAPNSDVARQLGVCGCVVANEMEIAEVDARNENAAAVGRKTAWTFSEIYSGTIFPVKDWPALFEFLNAANKPGLPSKDHRSPAVIRQQLKQKLRGTALESIAPDTLTKTRLDELIRPTTDSDWKLRGHAKQRMRAPNGPRRESFPRNAPQSTSYNRLGRRKM